MRIAIIAALPGELKPLVKRWKHLPSNHRGVRLWTRTTADYEAVAACAGMGADAARRCVAAVEALGPIEMLLSVGWAGALTESSQPGECSILSEIIDAQTGERFVLSDGSRKLRIVSTAHVADAAEKQRLWQTYGAVLVDMEASALARLAQMRGIPMGCFKAVSDDLHARLPDLNAFIDPQGQMRMVPFLLHVAVRPRFWASLWTLGRTSQRAAEVLARKIDGFLQSRDLDTINRTGSI